MHEAAPWQGFMADRHAEARLLWEQRVAASNPVSPTIIFSTLERNFERTKWEYEGLAIT